MCIYVDDIIDDIRPEESESGPDPEPEPSRAEPSRGCRGCGVRRC
jgi:hypothetical protein